MRLSSKDIQERVISNGKSISSDFRKEEFDASLRDKGWSVIYEKAYKCPCQSESSGDGQNTCRNCGGTSLFWANPIRTRMIITGVKAQKDLKDIGAVDMGMVMVTAIEFDRLSRMDRIVLENGQSEHNQVLHVRTTDDGLTPFAYTKYDIIDIDNIMLFEGVGQKHTRLELYKDYNWRDNVVTFNDKYLGRENFSVSIRYIHAPVFYVWDVWRDTIVSRLTEGGRDQIVRLPVHGVAKRAHLIQDVENFDGDKLFDNSWDMTSINTNCKESLPEFERKIKYSTVQEIYAAMSDSQKQAMQDLIETKGLPQTLPFNLD